LDVEAKEADANAKLRDAEARDGRRGHKDLADLGSMNDDTRAWFLKKRAEIRTRDD
jgi:hypothetical protein